MPERFDGLNDGDRTWFVPADDGGRVQLWSLPSHRAHAPALLYLHGTFRNAYQNYPKMHALREAGYDVVAVEYRGWGESSALVPSEQSIVADARIGWQALRALQPDASRRVVYGHSMGGGAAVALAAQLPADDYAGLVLESTFTSLPALAARYGWLIGWLARLTGQRFDSLSRIGAVHGPVLVMHGTADDTVPWALGRALYEAAPSPKTFVSFEGGGHSTLQRDDPARYREALQAFARELGAQAREMRPSAQPMRAPSHEVARITASTTGSDNRFSRFQPFTYSSAPDEADVVIIVPNTQASVNP